MNDSVRFRLTYSITGPPHLSASVNLEFQWLAGTSDCILKLERSDRKAVQAKGLTLIATVSRALDSELDEMFRDLIDGRLPRGSNPKLAASSLNEIGELKPRHIPPLQAMPLRFQQFCSSAYDEMYAAIEKAAGLLRWRTGLTDSTLQMLRFEVCSFAIDGDSWHSVPHSITVHFGIGFPRKKDGVTQTDIDSVRYLYEEGYFEPVSRSLFREAWNLMRSSPQSALMLGYAAIEVGCKELISSLVPDATWLAFEAPSPPLENILKRYVPTLPVRLTVKGKVMIPKRILKFVDEAMRGRNALAHKGKQQLVSDDRLEAILRGFNDLLWLFDLYVGHQWAWEHISVETQRDLISQSEVALPS